MSRRGDRRHQEEQRAPSVEASHNPNPDGGQPSLEPDQGAGDDASTPDGQPDPPADPSGPVEGEGADGDAADPPEPPELPFQPADPRLVAMIVEFAKTHGATEDELDGLQQHCSAASQGECERMLAEFEASAKAERAARAKREAREKERAARIAEREAFEQRKAQARRRGRVLCRAIKTCSVEGMARYRGEEFSLPRPEAQKREDRGELEVL